MKHFFKSLIILALLVNIVACSSSKKAQKSKTQTNTQQQTAAVADSTKTGSKALPSIGKFFKEKPTETKGLTNVYVSSNRYYLEISDSLLGKDLLMVTRLLQASAKTSSYSGDHVGTQVLRFEKAKDQKIILRSISYKQMSKDSTMDMYQSVMQSNLQTIIAAFEIKALSADKTGSLIDVTDLLNSDNPFFAFSKNDKTFMQIASLQADKSYINEIKTYPLNTEVQTIKTYALSNGDMATFEFNNSFVKLPENLMTSRYYDERVGYFANGYVDYDQNPQGVENVYMISRWRLEPKPEDVEKYKNGELVEPQKPIIYYIDPTTPEKWVPYLMQGVNDWQKAFEKAGFKNAIMAKRAPTKEEDSTWSLQDARYSAIVYKPSSIPNASGPHIADPRSGEILESHINWYHNVMKLLHDWYFIQCSVNDTAARKMTFNTELMGELIRFVSSHEVGHTLGLRHNFGSSSLIPSEKLRDTNFLKTDGFSYSIMDYARFNYVAQPEDHIRRELLFPKIGLYDDWAIEWGYRLFPDINDPKKELPKMNQWVIEKSKDARLWFGTESNSNDPRSQSEDLGDNQMISNEYGIKNLKRVLDSLEQWTWVANEDYGNLAEMYDQLLTQYKRYTLHVIKWVGSIYQNPKRVEQEGAVYTFVGKDKQREAMDYLNRNIFTTPQWLLKEDIFSKTGQKGIDVIAGLQQGTLNALIQPRVMLNLLNAENQLKQNAYTLTDYFTDLNKNIFKELSAGGNVDIYRRSLQKTYIVNLLNRLPDNQPIILIRDSQTSSLSGRTDVTDITACIIAQLKNINKQLKTGKGDAITKAHYEYLSELISNKLGK